MSDRPATPGPFTAHMAEVARAIAGAPLDAALEARLDQDFGPGSAWFATAVAYCHQGVAEGWLCFRDARGLKFGRAVPAGEALDGFSVDVVEMENLAGAHHVHPNGEVDLIMPLDEAAEFDGKGAGWMVYGPGSAHAPTVTKGKALILYLLPGGAIEFTGQAQAPRSPN